MGKIKPGSIPSTMRAVQQDKPNGDLALREVPAPRPKAGEVLIRMAAAPINPSDLGALIGVSYEGERTYPFTPGIEGSGTVVTAGSGVMPRFLRGRRVACSAPTTGDGTWAEYMVTSASSCIPLRGNVSFEAGATLLVNPLTAIGLIELALTGRHRAIVSTAAASALGAMIERLGKRHHIPVIQIVRRAEQVDAVRARGGEHILDSSDSDFVERLRDEANRLHATLFLDALGGSLTEQLVDAAPFGSTIVLYSNLSQENSPIDPFTTLLKDLRFQGWFLGNWVRTKNLLQILSISRKTQSLIASDLKSPIAARLPLAEAQNGVESYVERMSAGKILLVADEQQVPLAANRGR